MSNTLPAFEAFIADMREIWLMQPRFEKRVGSAPFGLVQERRTADIAAITPDSLQQKETVAAAPRFGGGKGDASPVAIR